MSVCAIPAYLVIYLFLLFSGGVVIYFDRIEVVNILEATSGKI